jgi:hypothetical protein
MWAYGMRKGNSVELITEGTDLKSLKKHLSLQFFPASIGLCLTGDRVLVRKQVSSNSRTEATLLSHSTAGIASFAKASYVEEQTGELKSQGIKADYVYLGNYPSLNTDNASEEGPYISDGNRYAVNEAFNPITAKYSETLQGTLIALALGDRGVWQRETEHGYELAFNHLSMILAPILLLIAVTGFLFMNHYQKEQALSREELIRLERINADVLKEAKKYDELKTLLGYTGNRGTFTFFLSEIAHSVPESIKLDLIDINPISSTNMKPGKPIKFNDDIIRIEGITANAELLNQWVNKLKEFSRISKLEIHSFQKDENAEGFRFQLSAKTK